MLSTLLNAAVMVIALSHWSLLCLWPSCFSHMAQYYLSLQALSLPSSQAGSSSEQVNKLTDLLTKVHSLKLLYTDSNLPHLLLWRKSHLSWFKVRRRSPLHAIISSPGTPWNDCQCRHLYTASSSILLWVLCSCCNHVPMHTTCTPIGHSLHPPPALPGPKLCPQEWFN